MKLWHGDGKQLDRKQNVHAALNLMVTGYMTLMLSGCQPTSLTRPELATRLEAELNAIINSNGLPGMTVAVALADGTVVGAAAGLADRELSTPMTTRSRMLAASIGKTYVAATILALDRDGMLDVDDHISKSLGNKTWFDALPNHETITIRHLLRHTSGLPDHVQEPAFAQRVARMLQAAEPVAPEKLVGFVLHKPALFAAGTGWSYTDTGYILLGLVAEQVSGQAYYKFIQSRFLTPLGLTHTAPSNRKNLPGLAAGYLADDNPFGLPPKTTDKRGVMVWNPAVEWTGGGLVSTSNDLAVWGKALFEGKALEEDYLNLLLESVATSSSDSSQGYGAGVFIQKKGRFGPTYGHRGSIPGYSSNLRYYPDKGVAIAFQINADIADTDIPVMAMFEERLASSVFSNK